MKAMGFDQFRAALAQPESRAAIGVSAPEPYIQEMLRDDAKLRAMYRRWLATLPSIRGSDASSQPAPIPGVLPPLKAERDAQAGPVVVAPRAAPVSPEPDPAPVPVVAPTTAPVVDEPHPGPDPDPDPDRVVAEEPSIVESSVAPPPVPPVEPITPVPPVTSEAPSAPAAPADWYPDPQDSGMVRYWDGSTWTGHTAPAPRTPPERTSVSSGSASSGSASSGSATSSYYTPPSQRPSRGNPLGLASLIVGILATLGAFIPVVNLGSGIVAIVGLVLGIVALFLAGRSKPVAVAGVVVSLVGLVLSIALSTAYLGSFFDAVESGGVGVGSSGDGTADQPADTSTGELGTRDNPYPIGSTISFTQSGQPFYDITVGAPTLDANAIVAAENQFNEAAPAGQQYALLPLTVTYTGAETGTPGFDISTTFVAADGTTYEPSDVTAVGPSELYSINELYPGGTGTGNVIIAIPSADIDQGRWLLKVGFIGRDEVFIAAQ